MGGFTRRDFLRAAGLGLAQAHGGAFRLFAQAGEHPLFEQVPPSASGISFCHVNGRSPEYFLPETTGAGCAFFDYDHDGWMDIYLVNSG
jgi:hypothetical protein